MRRPILISAFGAIVFIANSLAQETPQRRSLVNLEEIGYPRELCKYEGKAQIEFLDSTRLLVSFPFHPSPCDGKTPFQPKEWRAALVDGSGKILHTMDFEAGQIVRAGPEGRILVLTENELRILDSDLASIQTLPWPREADPAQTSHGAWSATTDIELAPSRRGFAVRGPYPKCSVAYFEGNPVKPTVEADSCSPSIAVTDGGFACHDPNPSARLVVHAMNDDLQFEDPLFQKSEWVAIPSTNRALILTNKFQLYQFIRPGKAEKVADLRWLAPIYGYPRTSYALTSSAAHRILVYSWGFRFPLSDASGIGGHSRIIILDYESGQIVFRNEYNLGTDYAVSPNGRSLAIREKNLLSIVDLP